MRGTTRGLLAAFFVLMLAVGLLPGFALADDIELVDDGEDVVAEDVVVQENVAQQDSIENGDRFVPLALRGFNVDVIADADQGAENLKGTINGFIDVPDNGGSHDFFAAMDSQTSLPSNGVVTVPNKTSFQLEDYNRPNALQLIPKTLPEDKYNSIVNNWPKDSVPVSNPFAYSVTSGTLELMEPKKGYEQLAILCTAAGTDNNDATANLTITPKYGNESGSSATIWVPDWQEGKIDVPESTALQCHRIKVLNGDVGAGTVEPGYRMYAVPFEVDSSKELTAIEFTNVQGEIAAVFAVSALPVHSWTYSASGATITASCSFEDCTVTTAPTLTIEPPTLKAEGGSGSAEVTVKANETWIDANYLDGYEVAYYKGSTELDEAPTTAGSYTATLTVGDVTTKVDYTIADCSVTYEGHAQTYGDLTAVSDGKTLGTIGEAKRLEAFSAKVEGIEDASISYRAHLQKTGWTGWASDGNRVGTTGEARRMEAIQMKIDNAPRLHVWYRAYCQTWGWLGWAHDGEPAGTANQAKRLEAAEVVLLPDGVDPAKELNDYKEGQPSYIGFAMGEAHVQAYGWRGTSRAGVIGTTGKSKRLEALSLKLVHQPLAGGIEYDVHLQGKGWKNGYADGAVAGTTGQSRRLEAVRIRLTGDMESSGKYSVWYRVHSQTYGWLGWAKDGEPAGTTGLSKRAEAIDVQVLPRGQRPASYIEGQAACVDK